MVHVIWTLLFFLSIKSYKFYSFDKEDREAEDSDAEEEDEMNGNNDSEDEGQFNYNLKYWNFGLKVLMNHAAFYAYIIVRPSYTTLSCVRLSSLYHE